MRSSGVEARTASGASGANGGASGSASGGGGASSACLKGHSRLVILCP